MQIPYDLFGGSMQLPAAVYAPVVGAAVDPTQPVRRKRGRPRKVPGQVAPVPGALCVGATAGMPMMTSATAVSPDVAPPPKRRGRPPGSKNKISKSGPTLAVAMLAVKAGEDLVATLRATCLSLRRNLVLLSATGTLRAATLTQVGATGAPVPVTLHGHFTLLSLSGSVLVPTSAAVPEPSGWLSASLADPTGRVYGGAVGGSLEAVGCGVTLVVGHYEPAKPAAEGAQDQVDEHHARMAGVLGLGVAQHLDANTVVAAAAAAIGSGGGAAAAAGADYGAMIPGAGWPDGRVVSSDSGHATNGIEAPISSDDMGAVVGLGQPAPVMLGQQAGEQLVLDQQAMHGQAQQLPQQLQQQAQLQSQHQQQGTGGQAAPQLQPVEQQADTEDSINRALLLLNSPRTMAIVREVFDSPDGVGAEPGPQEDRPAEVGVPLPHMHALESVPLPHAPMQGGLPPPQMPAEAGVPCVAMVGAATA